MLTGHASHQIGLDADIWLTPMPDRTLSATERENMSAVSMIKKKGLTVNEKVWTPAHARLLRRAASYPEVERILVHPGIKKKLCDTVTGDRPGSARSARSGATTIISTSASAASPARPAARRRPRPAPATAATSRWPGGSPRSHGARTRTPTRRRPAT